MYKGKFFDVTAEHVAAAVSYFHSVRAARGQQTVIDYEHKSITGEEAPASGWIHRLIAKTDGLYGMVEWTNRAAEFIRNKEYKYLSPVLLFGVRNELTGEQVLMKLLSVALTNTPHLPDIREVVAKYQVPDGAELAVNSIEIASLTLTGVLSMDLQEIIEQLKTLLGLSAEAPASEILPKVKTIVQAAEALGGQGTPPETAIQEAAALRTDLATLFKVQPAGILAAARLAHDAIALRSDIARLIDTTDDKVVIMSRLAELKSGKTPDNFVPLSQFQALEQRLTQRDADDFLRDNEKRIPPADREKYRGFYLKDAEMTRAMVASLPELVDGKEIRTVTETHGSVTLTSEELELCRVTGRDPKDFAAMKAATV